MNTGLVFGVFDGLHEGHRAMLEQARFRVDRLVVALPSDRAVEGLKSKIPSQLWEVRSQALRDSGLVDDVVLGDETLGEYHILDVVQPDVVLLGYDQRDLKKDLERFCHDRPSSPHIVSLEPFEPERYKSSLLNTV